MIYTRFLLGAIIVLLIIYYVMIIGNNNSNNAMDAVGLKMLMDVTNSIKNNK